MEKPDTTRPPADSHRLRDADEATAAPAPTALHEVAAQPAGPPEAVTPYDEIWFQRRPLS